MLSEFSYPIICTEKFVQTVAFYEDHFGYVSAFELDGFVILQREDWPNMYLAVIDSNHSALPEEYRQPSKGMILNMPIRNAAETFDDVYYDGLDILSPPRDAMCGRKHFFVSDPNGILLDLAENVDLDVLNAAGQTTSRCEAV